MTSRPIYLDHAATAPLHPAVLEAMLPWLAENSCNPAAAYAGAREAEAAVERARAQCAGVIGALPVEIVFTSGGTESDNHALLAAVELTGKTQIVTTSVEHPAVLRACEALEARGVRVTRLPVNREGVVSLSAAERAIGPDTALVSVMAANNEVGTIQPLAALGELCRSRGVLLHTDAVQAYGHIPLDAEEMRFDLLSASAHKLGGPKGVGLLYIRRGTDLPPLLRGGGQENGLRSGTVNVPGIVGFGEAAQRAAESLSENASRIAALRDRLIDRILTENPGASLNGSTTARLPGNAHVSFPGIDGAELVALLDAAGVWASSGSACSARSGSPSHVLAAMGLGDEEVRGSLRLTLGEENTEKEIDLAADAIRRAAAGLKEFDF